MHDIAELKSIMPFMIPIVAIVMGVGIGMLGLWTDYRKKREIFELHHKERMLAIERGMEVPPLPESLLAPAERESSKGPVSNDYLRRGLLWLLVGLAISTALALNLSLNNATWGLIPVAVGLAYLIYYAVDTRQRAAVPPSGDPN